MKKRKEEKGGKGVACFEPTFLTGRNIGQYDNFTTILFSGLAHRSVSWVARRMDALEVMFRVRCRCMLGAQKRLLHL